MDWTPDSVAAATGGRVRGGDRWTSLLGVATDSRGLVPGSLFVALQAERDGHTFIDAAVAAGAGAVMVASSWGGTAGVPVVEVDDTSIGLLELGSAARNRLDGAVVGITGSVGKTSTKDLVAAALEGHLVVAASEKSFNNEIGVPLTLANAPENAGAVVVEMGARGIGQLSALSQIVRQTIGVVTAVAAAHTDAFGSIEGVAKAKSELVAALPASGVAVLNADDPRVAAMAEVTPAQVLRYSAAGSAEADVVTSSVSVDDQLRAGFVATTPWGSVAVRLDARGAHQVGNALAALGVAGSCGVPLEVAAAGLERARLSPWRMEVTRTASGATVINDAYNANPSSMAAALEALAAVPARRRVAVLGEMAELGEQSGEEHAAIASLAGSLGVELIAVGTDAYGVEAVGSIDEALVAIGSLGPDDAVLVKASRVAGLERLAAALAGS